MTDAASLSEVTSRLRAAGCVFAEDEAEILTAAARTPGELIDMVDRRAAGLPLEHVVGWAEFCGLRIDVDERVFVPRRRTEFLVSEAVAYQRSRRRYESDTGRPIVVDVCCGAGGLGVAVAASIGSVELHSADVDPVAVACARRNVSAAGGVVYEGDLFDPLPPRLRGKVALVLANAPYVPTDELEFLPPEARIHEARVALDGGPDGLRVLRRVMAQAVSWLAPGGAVLVESSDRQASDLAEAAVAGGLLPRMVISEEFEATVVIATRPGVERDSGAD